MNIGLYFGSFNPVHHGHLIIANHIINETTIKEVWFIVSPQNPFKKTTTLLSEQHRLQLVKIAIDDTPGLRASNIEFTLPKPSYTIDTLMYLEEKYPQHHFEIIMGSDGFQNIDKWKNGSQILKNYKIIVYERPGFIMDRNDAAITLVNAPLLDISSTQIRRLIKEKKSIRYLVPETVLKEIETQQYYSSILENKA